MGNSTSTSTNRFLSTADSDNILIVIKGSDITVEHMNYISDLLRQIKDKFPDQTGIELTVIFDGNPITGYNVNLRINDMLSYGFSGLDESAKLDSGTTIDLFDHQYDTGCRCHIVNPVLGKAMQSRIESRSVKSMTRRSKPKAIPPCGGAPY